MKTITKNLALILLTALLLQGCGSFNGNEESGLTASGTIETKSVGIAPEIGGVVSEVLAEEGNEVTAGDILFRMNSELLQSQLDLAGAAVTTAAASLDAAKVMQENADLQYELAVQNSRAQFSEALANEWRQNQSTEFDQPVWYFTRDEQIETAKVQVDSSAEELAKSLEKLDSVLKDIKNVDFVELEKELSAAQTEYLIADAAQEYVSKALDSKPMDDSAKDAFDLKQNQLDDVQKRYDQALDTQAAEDVLECAC